MIKVIAITIFSFLYHFGYSQNEVVHESSEIGDRLVTNPIVHPNPSYGKLQVNLSKYSDSSFEIVIKNIMGLNGETLSSFRLVIIDP